MPRDTTQNLPPPLPSADRGSPQMSGEPAVGDMLRRIATRGVEPDAEAQSANLLLQGAEFLIQAARINPTLAPIVQSAIQILRDGALSLSRGGVVPQPPTRKRRRAVETPSEPTGMGMAY